MPVPVIDTTTSILGYPQYQTFEFQPAATESPTSWACTPLPTGVSFNTATGKFTGAGTVAGVTSCSLTATNGSGTSTALIVTIGIEENTQLPDQAPAFAIDLGTGMVLPTVGVPPEEGDALFWIKEGDLMPILIKFYQSDAYVDFNPSSLKLVLKQYEPESGILSEGGATLNTHFAKLGTLTDASWVMVLDISEAALSTALADNEADAGTFFYALAEIQWEWTNPFAVGSTPLRRSSRTFLIGVERDLVP